MSLEPKLSRFAILPDDVPEPIGKKSSSDKAKKKQVADVKGGKNGAGDGAKKKKASGPKGKSLKSLAFGSASEDKRKAAANANSNSSQSVSQPNPLTNGAKRSSEQWDDWQRRDHELVDEVYETDLEAALIQSQLDFQNELARQEAAKAAGKGGKGKKKGITVPLNEFNAMLLDTPKSNDPPSLYADVGDDELIERYRAEAKIQLEREKDIAQQRELLANRQAEGVYKHPNSKARVREVEVDEQTKTIENLRAENELLKSELESYKSRLKKVHDIFQSAQELKDKAKLIFQVENLTKIQEDLQDQILELHSQLEQERSKSHAAINEHRRLVEQSRRRTNTEAST